MDNKQRFKLYYQKTVESARLARQLSEQLDLIRQYSLKFDHDNVTVCNQQVVIVSDAIAQLHQERKALAVQLGCTQRRYAAELVHRVGGPTGEKLKAASDALHDAIAACQDKAERHTQLMVQQQHIVQQATESLRIQVHA
ncbi:flagellar export chaperone FlgN [Vibrio furnissii]